MGPGRGGSHRVRFPANEASLGGLPRAGNGRHGDGAGEDERGDGEYPLPTGHYPPVYVSEGLGAWY